jgi:diamine N-acetyltransferase
MIHQNLFEIVLRAPEPSDVEFLYQWENDPEVWHVSNTITPFSKHIIEKYIENAHLDIYEAKQLRLMIDLKKAENRQSHTIGTIDLFDFDPYHNRAGIGILIGDKLYRKKGYATRALQKFINYGFNILQLHQLYCNILQGNKESLRLFKGCGFKVTGRKIDWIRTPGCYCDELILQLINPAGQFMS